MLYDAYKDHLKLPEDILYSRIRGKLEDELAEAVFEDEDIEEEERHDISGKARFLIRKLCAKGWFQKEAGENFQEYITVPGYSSRMLELLHQLRDNSPMRGYSYVFGTYSTLKVADESDSSYDKMAAVYGAYENTESLIRLLKMVYHNIKHYFQIQSELTNINEVLSSHFDEYSRNLAEAYIRPLKIKDSVPKYKNPIRDVLHRWLDDDALLTAMCKESLGEKRFSSISQCRNDLLTKIYWIIERYENMEAEYLDEIDKQVRRYTRATTQKLEILSNRDQTVRGNLNYLLTQLGQKKRDTELSERIQGIFHLYEQSTLTSKSLWHQKRPTKRKRSEPVAILDSTPDVQIRTQANNLLKTEYDKTHIRLFLQNLLEGKSSITSMDWTLSDDKAYIMNLLSVLDANSRDATHNIKELDGIVSQNGYTIPNMEISRREGKK